MLRFVILLFDYVNLRFWLRFFYRRNLSKTVSMRSYQNPEQVWKTVVVVSSIFVGGIAVLSSLFVVPAGEVGVVTTLGKV